MTTPGPWDNDPMWVPDVQPGEIPDDEPTVVRQHYFMVVGTVYSDGTRTLDTTDDVCLDMDKPVWNADMNEWTGNDNCREDDDQFVIELVSKLGRSL